VHHQPEDGSDSNDDDGNHDVEQHASMATRRREKGNLRDRGRSPGKGVGESGSTP
jgi:hypothetical protein